jgi:signal transduction histidine kinase
MAARLMRDGSSRVYGHRVAADRARRWIKELVRRARALPIVVQDGVLAGVMLVLSVISIVTRGPDDFRSGPWAYVIVVVGVSALTWRRIHSLGAMVVAVGAAVALSSLGMGDAGLPFVAVIAFYSVAAYARRRTRLVAFLLLGVGFAILLLRSRSSGFDKVDLFQNALLFSIAWIIGEAMRARRERLADALERATRAERERDAEARQAVSSERLRIAQELHDVVAHAMSVIAVQSGMGAHVIDTQPAEAKKALQAIESTSRMALDELRRMLGVLREEGDRGGALAPAPRADDVETLIDTVRAAGIPVELRWDGLTAEVMPPDSVLLNRYRILQEALTNVLKHAGTASVVVTIVERIGETTIEVVDNGRGLAAAKAPGTPGGHGLVGMRERVALFGGSLEAGSRPGGGFRVFARLKWVDTADREPSSLVEQK